MMSVPFCSFYAFNNTDFVVLVLGGVEFSDIKLSGDLTAIRGFGWEGWHVV